MTPAEKKLLAAIAEYGDTGTYAYLTKQTEIVDALFVAELIEAVQLYPRIRVRITTKGRNALRSRLDVLKEKALSSAIIAAFEAGAEWADCMGSYRPISVTEAAIGWMSWSAED